MPIKAGQLGNALSTTTPAFGSVISYRVNTAPIPITVYRSMQKVMVPGDKSSTLVTLGALYCLPTLVFLGGGYPRVGIFGYESLLRHIASKGINVLVPQYIPSPADAKKETAEGLVVLRKGYDSTAYAKNIEQSLDDFFSRSRDGFCNTDWPRVLYGHSMGARVALALGRARLSGRSWNAVLLEGFADSEKIKDSYDPFREDRPLALDGPLTIVYGDHDSLFGKASDRLYLYFQGIGKNRPIFAQGVPAKQLIVIEDPRANHFSPFSDDPPTHHGALALLWDEIAKSLHGYSPTFQLDGVDWVDTYTLLPALALSASHLDQLPACSTPSAPPTAAAKNLCQVNHLLRSLTNQAKAILYGPMEGKKAPPARLRLEQQGLDSLFPAL